MKLANFLLGSEMREHYALNTYIKFGSTLTVFYSVTEIQIKNKKEANTFTSTINQPTTKSCSTTDIYLQQYASHFATFPSNGNTRKL